MPTAKHNDIILILWTSINGSSKMLFALLHVSVRCGMFPRWTLTKCTEDL